MNEDKALWPNFSGCKNRRASQFMPTYPAALELSPSHFQLWSDGCVDSGKTTHPVKIDTGPEEYWQFWEKFCRSFCWSIRLLQRWVLRITSASVSRQWRISLRTNWDSGNWLEDGFPIRYRRLRKRASRSMKIASRLAATTPNCWFSWNCSRRRIVPLRVSHSRNVYQNPEAVTHCGPLGSASRRT
jgi:hypothetical protein